MTAHVSLQPIILDILEQAKKLGMDQAEVSASIESGFSVTARMGDVETLEHQQEKNLQITVYKGHRNSSSSSSDFSPDALLSVLQKTCAMTDYTEQDPYSGLADAQSMATHYPDLHLFHPWHLTPTEAIDMAIHCESMARKQDPRIKNSEGASVSTYQSQYIYANTHGFLGDFSTTEHSIDCCVIAEINGEMQRDFEYTIARDANQLQTVAWVAEQVAEKTVRRLGARKISTRQCPVIFHASVARNFLGNFVSAISGYHLYRRTSFLCDHLGKMIFPSLMTIYQEPHLASTIGSSPFDDEGVATQKIVYVENGMLQSYVLDSYSARKLGLPTTGNSGGVFNLLMSQGDKNLAALCKAMGTGLLVTELIGQGVNLMTGDYSRGVFGFWVEKGEIQYPVQEVTIAGNLRDMFQGVQLIGNDVDYRGNIKTGSILLSNMVIAGH